MPTNYDMGPDEGGAVQSSPKVTPPSDNDKKTTTKSVDSSKNYSNSLV